MFFISCKESAEITPLLKITSFSIIDNNSASTIIEENNKTITISLPFNSNVSSLRPKIEISVGASIIPASGSVQDFRKPIYYTLTAKGGQKVIYTVIVKLLKQPIPEITLIKIDSVEAGLNFEISGKNFGKFGLDVQTYLIDASKKEIEVSGRLIDSTKINVNTAIETIPGFYDVKIKVKDQEVISKSKIWISYPSPQVIKIEKQFFINADTLWLSAKYIDVTKYKLQLQLLNGTNSMKLDFTKAVGDQLGFVIPANVQANTYNLKLFNKTENKYSREPDFKIEIFDAKKPYVENIIDPKSSYKKGDIILFKTINFDKIEARFYQISLIGANKSYIQNGIFDMAKNTLSLVLPESILKGKYSLEFSLLEPTKNINYSFNTNLNIELKD